MKNLKKFNNTTEYNEYLNSDNVVLPRVSKVENKAGQHTTNELLNDNGPSFIEYSKVGDEFIQVANDGTMYFTDMVIDNVSYKAEIQGDTIVITTTDITTGERTNNAYIDDATGSIIVTYPNGNRQIYQI